MTKDLRAADKVALGGNWALAQSHDGEHVPHAACALCMRNEKIFVTQNNAIKKFTTRTHPMITVQNWASDPGAEMKFKAEMTPSAGRLWRGGLSAFWCRQVPVSKKKGHMFIAHGKK